MAMPQFANEAEFRERWVKPFLAKLGYTNVTHTHGTDEQGKDFFFADYDRFEHLRFHAGQVKIGNIGTGKALGDLLDQVKRCFQVRVRDRKGADGQRISAVYIFTTGSISPEARHRITEHCHQEHYGENIYFLDGERLEHLDRFSCYHEDRRIRSILEAILTELEPARTHSASSPDLIANATHCPSPSSWAPRPR